MKYIRTKDGIYEVTKDTKGTKFIVVGKSKTLLDYETFVPEDDDIITEANSIEELCDSFVVIGNKHTIWDKQHCLGLTFEQVKQSYSAYDFEIYGAVWTSKGLIYVAKLNGKGELELI